jgi:hypothetical protein
VSAPANGAQASAAAASEMSLTLRPLGAAPSVTRDDRVETGPRVRAVEHRLDCGDLSSSLHCVIEVDIATPVPTTVRVERRAEIGHRIARDRLRIEDDQMIGIGPFVIPRMLNVAVRDRIVILLAAMQCDMDPGWTVSNGMNTGSSWIVGLQPMT